MSWKKLQPVTVWRTSEPWIGVQKSGKLTWSKEIDVLMGSPAEVELYYDAGHVRLGLKPAANGGGIKVHKEGRSFAGRPMLKAAGIWDRLELPIRQCPAKLDDVSGIWAISIKPEAELLNAVNLRTRRAVEVAPEDDTELEEDV